MRNPHVQQCVGWDDDPRSYTLSSSWLSRDPICICLRSFVSQILKSGTHHSSRLYPVTFPRCTQPSPCIFSPNLIPTHRCKHFWVCVACSTTRLFHHMRSVNHFAPKVPTISSSVQTSVTLTPKHTNGPKSPFLYHHLQSHPRL